jgi:hypothetical protein
MSPSKMADLLERIVEAETLLRAGPIPGAEARGNALACLTFVRTTLRAEIETYEEERAA